ncbi:hypothetical protein LTR70_009484 [Exophiala xenobiotica]|uniref:Uncharacterized protein n=1 Tax=Lithohypha guttulata TaxID=1690604 RepID=A0ABR0JYQ1_9EURO|nr:hypothetical protein LTR24_009380 [Lithohypha guttulata]KAK5310416.1 hypothetical protein LTR70_009484 [Exophiala xenobiotica]
MWQHLNIEEDNRSITAHRLPDGQAVVLNHSTTARWSTFRFHDKTFLLFDDDHLRDQVNEFRKGYPVHETEALPVVKICHMFEARAISRVPHEFDAYIRGRFHQEILQTKPPIQETWSWRHALAYASDQRGNTFTLGNEGGAVVDACLESIQPTQDHLKLAFREIIDRKETESLHHRDILWTATWNINALQVYPREPPALSGWQARPGVSKRPGPARKRSRPPSNDHSLDMRQVPCPAWGYPDLPPYRAQIGATPGRSKAQVFAEVDPRLVRKSTASTMAVAGSLAGQEDVTVELQDRLRELPLDGTSSSPRDIAEKDDKNWPNVLETLLEDETEVLVLATLPTTTVIHVRVLGYSTRSYAGKLVDTYGHMVVTTTDIDVITSKEFAAEKDRYDCVLLMDVETWVRNIDSTLAWAYEHLKPYGYLEVHGMDSVAVLDNDEVAEHWRATQNRKRDHFGRDLTREKENWVAAVQKRSQNIELDVQSFHAELRPSVFDRSAESEMTKLGRISLKGRNRLDQKIAPGCTAGELLGSDGSMQDLMVDVKYFVCVAFGFKLVGP